MILHWCSRSARLADRSRGSPGTAASAPTAAAATAAGARAAAGSPEGRLSGDGALHPLLLRPRFADCERVNAQVTVLPVQPSCCFTRPPPWRSRVPELEVQTPDLDLCSPSLPSDILVLTPERFLGRVPVSARHRGLTTQCIALFSNLAVCRGCVAHLSRNCYHPKILPNAGCDILRVPVVVCPIISSWRHQVATKRVCAWQAMAEGVALIEQGRQLLRQSGHHLVVSTLRCR